MVNGRLRLPDAFRDAKDAPSTHYFGVVARVLATKAFRFGWWVDWWFEIVGLRWTGGKRRVVFCAHFARVWRRGGGSPLILNLGPRWGEWSTSHFGHFFSGNATYTCWIRSWVGTGVREES